MAATRPNIVLIMTDDQGYGDLGCYGSDVLRTPHVDRMASEGVRFTDFYSCAPVCTPARANLMTGRYAQRVGLPGVLFPHHREGLSQDFSTNADCLRAAGYGTAMFGKWHLGCHEEHYPTRHGFDEYLGLLYSNDMQPERLYDGERVVEEPVDQATLTRRYTERAIDFARRTSAAGRPFFIYIAHTMPHIPLHVEAAWRGRSKGGLYGDTIECIDHYVGVLLEALDEMGAGDDTLVVFTSDNGPWFEGSVGSLRGRKFSVYEGGIRMPCVVRWPGGIEGGQTSGAVGAFMDFLPTFVSLAGGELPQGEAPLDGVDISVALRGGAIAERTLFFYQGWHLNACRRGRWKLHVAERQGGELLTKEMPQLFDLEADMGENYNLAQDHAEIVEQLRGEMEDFSRQAGFQMRSYTRAEGD